MRGPNISNAPGEHNHPRKFVSQFMPSYQWGRRAPSPGMIYYVVIRHQPTGLAPPLFQQHLDMWNMWNIVFPILVADSNKSEALVEFL